MNTIVSHSVVDKETKPKDKNRFATIKNNYAEKGLALANTGVQRRREAIESLKSLGRLAVLIL